MAMPKILVIEDETDFRRLYRRDLETEGYSVVTAQSRATGLDIMDDVSPDLVLFDVDQPNMDALDAMKQLMGHCPRVPVVLVLPQPFREDSFICSAADAYVARSLDTKPLRAKIRQLFAPEAV